MNYIARKKRRENNKIFIGIIIAISIIISIYLLSVIKIPFLSTVSSKIIYGVDSLISSVVGAITDGTSYFGNVKKLNLKIEELESKLEETDMLKAQMSVLEVENSDLKKLLEIKERYSHFKLEYANIITRSYDSWNETFIINKGKNDGITKRQTVISKEGLVGYISEVRDNTSVVTTILDTTSSVSVEISNINALALVKGDFSLKNNQKLKLVNIPIDIELAVGETVYSSGIGALYKKGIPIGTISEVISKKNNIDRYAIVNTFVDITSLDIVGIIVN